MMHVAGVFLSLCSLFTSDGLEVSQVFSDNMVLQANAEVPVWGWAGPGKEVALEIGEYTLSTTSDVNGNWLLKLPPFGYGGDFKMLISSGKKQIKLDNIVFGDVWLCAGQSNMRFELSRSLNGREAIQNAGTTDIRQLKVSELAATEEQKDISAGEWQVAGPGTAKDFTAVGYYFANSIFKNTGNSIGLINATRGGSRIETWMSASLFPEGHVKYVLDSVADLEQRYKKQLVDKIGYEPTAFSGAESLLFWNQQVLDQTWINHELPGRWEAQGFPNLDGEVYYTRDFTIENIRDADEKIQVRLATIDDADSVWVNGEFIGASKGWNVERTYSFSSKLLKKGANRLLIKVNDVRGSGGVRGRKSDMFLLSGKTKIDLSGTWKFRVVELKHASPVRPRYLPTLFYNAMIHPIVRFPVKGILWYQGENNARTVTDAKNYSKQFAKLIEDWRRLFGHPELPFLFVQLPNHDAANIEPGAWAALRESQTEVMHLSATGMAVTIDLGDATDIHPVRKEQVGERLSKIALSQVYGLPIDYESPFVKSVEISDNQVILNLSEQIKTTHPEVDGFELIDTHNEWIKVKGNVIGRNKIVIHRAAGFEARAIRYAWGNDPDFSPVYDIAGLPLAPFNMSISK